MTEPERRDRPPSTAPTAVVIVDGLAYTYESEADARLFFSRIKRRDPGVRMFRVASHKRIDQEEGDPS